MAYIYIFLILMAAVLDNPGLCLVIIIAAIIHATILDKRQRKDNEIREMEKRLGLDEANKRYEAEYWKTHQKD